MFCYRRVFLVCIVGKIRNRDLYKNCFWLCCRAVSISTQKKMIANLAKAATNRLILFFENLCFNLHTLNYILLKITCMKQMYSVAAILLLFAQSTFSQQNKILSASNKKVKLVCVINIIGISFSIFPASKINFIKKGI